jgi:hypothetical protein
LKPDLLDADTAEVYEIKPRHLFGAGFLELQAYIGALHMNDPQDRAWQAGATYGPPIYFFEPSFGGWDVFVQPPIFGVIGYEAFNRTAGTAALAGLALGVGARALAPLSNLATNAMTSMTAGVQIRLNVAIAVPGF